MPGSVQELERLIKSGESLGEFHVKYVATTDQERIM
jgi:hypothetical protein